MQKIKNRRREETEFCTDLCQVSKCSEWRKAVRERLCSLRGLRPAQRTHQRARHAHQGHCTRRQLTASTLHTYKVSLSTVGRHT